MHPLRLSPSLSFALAFAAPTALPTSAHADEAQGHTILLRVCVVGSDTPVYPNANDPNPIGLDATPGTLTDRAPVLDVLNASNEIWAQANINWFPLTPDGTATVPVIADPNQDSGQLGDIQPFEGVGEELDAADACAAAWASHGHTEGIIFVIARDVLGPALGVTQPKTIYNADPALCSHPRTLLTTDLPEFIVVSDRAVLDASTVRAHEIWAHELGHALLLGHGDGLDQAPFGVQPPQDGPRLYDSYCDVQEPLTGNSLMGAQWISGGNITLTPLQIEAALEAAAVAPQENTTCSVGPRSDGGAALMLLALVALGASRRRRARTRRHRRLNAWLR